MCKARTYEGYNTINTLAEFSSIIGRASMIFVWKVKLDKGYPPLSITNYLYLYTSKGILFLVPSISISLYILLDKIINPFGTLKLFFSNIPM